MHCTSLVGLASNKRFGYTQKKTHAAIFFAVAVHSNALWFKKIVLWHYAAGIFQTRAGELWKYFLHSTKNRTKCGTNYKVRNVNSYQRGVYLPLFPGLGLSTFYFNCISSLLNQALKKSKANGEEVTGWRPHQSRRTSVFQTRLVRKLASLLTILTTVT